MEEVEDINEICNKIKQQQMKQLEKCWGKKEDHKEMFGLRRMLNNIRR